MSTDPKITVRWEVVSAYRSTEEDVFESGCIPGSGTAHMLDLGPLFAPTVAELVRQIRTDIDADPEDEAQLDACEEPGRIDFQILEDEDGSRANKRDMELWKKGEQRLWLADYTFRVERVTRAVLPLTGQE